MIIPLFWPPSVPASHFLSFITKLRFAYFLSSYMKLYLNSYQKLCLHSLGQWFFVERSEIHGWYVCIGDRTTLYVSSTKTIWSFNFFCDFCCSMRIFSIRSRRCIMSSILIIDEILSSFSSSHFYASFPHHSYILV